MSLTAYSRTHAPAHLAPSWRPERTVAVTGGGASLLAGICVYTPWVDPVVLVFLGPAVVFSALLAATGRRWTYLASGIAMALPALVVLLLFGEVAWVWDPHRGPWWDLLSITSLLYALLIGAPAAVLGFARFHRAPARLHMPALVVGSLLAGVTLAGALAAATAPEGTQRVDLVADHTVALGIADHAFSLERIEVPAGAVVALHVTNNDDAYHTFTYRVGGTTFDHPLPAGGSITVWARFPAGEAAFWCEPHPDMRGTIVAEPQG